MMQTIKILVVVFAAVLAVNSWSAAEERRPNVVLILADDVGYGDLGCYGATKIKTPHIDQLAQDGRRFTDAHSAAAVCTPSRYGLLTGQYAFRVNSWGSLGHTGKLIVDPQRLTVARLLKNAGYATACFGKWHLGFGNPAPDWNGHLKPGHRLNGDLLGFKFDAWEGGHRVPFILRWPGRIAAGTRSDQLLCHVDMLASLAAMTGVKLGNDDGPDSLNALPAWTGNPEQPVRDFALHAASKPTHLSLRQDRWVYIPAQGGGGFHATSGHALGGPAALHFTDETNSDIKQGKILPDAPPAQLYDLRADPSQRSNIIRQHPDVARRLAALLTKYKTEQRSTPVWQSP